MEALIAVAWFRMCMRQQGSICCASQSTSFKATIPVSDPELGDVVFFANTHEPGISHVGIYIGNGLQINAPTTGEVVGVAPVFTGYWVRIMQPPTRSAGERSSRPRDYFMRRISSSGVTPIALAICLSAT